MLHLQVPYMENIWTISLSTDELFLTIHENLLKWSSVCSYMAETSDSRILDASWLHLWETNNSKNAISSSGTFFSPVVAGKVDSWTIVEQWRPLPSSPLALVHFFFLFFLSFRLRRTAFQPGVETSKRGKAIRVTGNDGSARRKVLCCWGNRGPKGHTRAPRQTFHPSSSCSCFSTASVRSNFPPSCPLPPLSLSSSSPALPWNVDR